MTRAALLRAGAAARALARPVQLVHEEGETHPINAALVSFRARAAALAVALAGLWALNRAGVTSLVTWTYPLVPRDRIPVLFAALWLAYVAGHRTAGAARRRVLLAFSGFALVCFDPVFAAGVTAFFLAFYGIASAPVRRALKLAFALAWYAALAVACDMVLLPELGGAHPELLVFGYAFAVIFTFRIFYFLYEVRQRVALADFLLYFLFGPYFIIPPYMAAIPRFGRFAASLDRAAPGREREGLRFLLQGAGYTVLLHVARGAITLDPAAYLADGAYAHAALAGVLAYPIGAVLAAVGDAYILIGLLLVLSVDVHAPFRRPLWATSVLEWWRRWNIHFRDFLVDLFFYPVVLKLRKRPYLGVIAGCAAVFLLGSVAFHWIAKYHFAHNSYARVYWGTLVENGVMFALVAGALCWEQRRLRQRRRPAPEPRLDDTAVPVATWAGFQARRVAAIGATWLILLVTIGMANHGLHQLVYERPRAAAVTRAEVDRALRYDPTDPALRRKRAALSSPAEATREVEVAQRLERTLPWTSAPPSKPISVSSAASPSRPAIAISSAPGF